MSPPSLECHPHHCPIQASELAETRNEKAAFLSLAPLPITLKKGILLEKTPGDLSVWKGKGHSEQRPRDSHLFGQQSPPSHPNPHLLSWRQLLCLWLPSAPTEEADAVCHPGLFTIRWPFPNAGPCSRSTCPAACLSLSAGSASWSNQRWSLAGELLTQNLFFTALFPPASPLQTNACR